MVAHRRTNTAINAHSLVTEAKSLELVETMVFLTVNSVLYLRGVFPVEDFSWRTYDLKSNDCNFLSWSHEEAICRMSSNIPRIMIDNNKLYVKILNDGNSQKSRVLKWLHGGVADALKMKYLEELRLVLLDSNSESPGRVLEVYKIGCSYGSYGSVEMRLRSGRSLFAAATASSTKTMQETKRSISNVIAQLSGHLTETKLQANPAVSMELVMSDMCPMSYTIPDFEKRKFPSSSAVDETDYNHIPANFTTQYHNADVKVFTDIRSPMQSRQKSLSGPATPVTPTQEEPSLIEDTLPFIDSMSAARIPAVGWSLSSQTSPIRRYLEGIKIRTPGEHDRKERSTTSEKSMRRPSDCALPETTSGLGALSYSLSSPFSHALVDDCFQTPRHKLNFTAPRSAGSGLDDQVLPPSSSGLSIRSSRRLRGQSPQLTGIGDAVSSPAIKEPKESQIKITTVPDRPPNRYMKVKSSRDLELEMKASMVQEKQATMATSGRSGVTSQFVTQDKRTLQDSFQQAVSQQEVNFVNGHEDNSGFDLESAKMSSKHITKRRSHSSAASMASPYPVSSFIDASRRTRFPSASEIQYKSPENLVGWIEDVPTHAADGFSGFNLSDESFSTDREDSFVRSTPPADPSGLSGPDSSHIAVDNGNVKLGAPEQNILSAFEVNHTLQPQETFRPLKRRKPSKDNGDLGQLPEESLRRIVMTLGGPPRESTETQPLSSQASRSNRSSGPAMLMATNRQQFTSLKR